MRYLPWLVLVASGSARADALHATLTQPLIEVSHDVDIRIDGGVATYKVRRVFANPGKVADEASLAIDLPSGAAATGLRIRAHDTWYEGQLMESDKAAALYHELTGFGPYRPKDPALLQWQWADKLRLQVFPVMPGGVSTVEYTLTVPTRYASGRYWVSYPRVDVAETTGTDRDGATLVLATPIITVHPAWSTASTPIVVDGKRVAPGTPVALTAPPRQPWEQALNEPNASHVASAIAIPPSSHTSATFDKAKITLDITHTYKSDLKVDLITPEGQVITIHDGTGGGGNDLKGAYPIDLPADTHGAGTWRLVVSDHAALDTGTLDRWELELGEGKTAEHATSRDTPVFIPDAPESSSDAGVAAIAIDPPAIETWTARLGKVVASKDHAFGRLELDVAPQLRPVPQHAQVVFAIDASWSVGAEGLATQLDLVRAYVSHVPDAEIELVAYRRLASRVFGSFVPAKQLEQALAVARQRGALALGNGSALDEGARVAATALADRNGPRRLVLATDELLATSLSDPTLVAALSGLSADTIVHVVWPQLDNDDRVTLQRDDGDHLAALATHHHGIFATVRGLPAATTKQLAPVMLELVRPTRIEQLQVTGMEVEQTVLHEGDGLRLFVKGKTAPDKVVLTGVLWSDPVRKELTPAATFSRQTAAFVFGADEHQELSPDEMMKVAMIGRAVSPVTSYVAFEPGTRPSPIGLPDGGGTGWGTIGTGRYGTIGHGSGTGSSPPDLRSLVDVIGCEQRVRPPVDWSVELDVETTRDEIVDVAVAKGAGAMASCLVEAVWAVRLDGSFTLDRQQFRLSLAEK